MKENCLGIWISDIHINDSKLDWINKVLLSEIISLSKLEKGCIASNETFANLLGIHKGNVSKRITYLIEEGYIKIKLIKKGEKRTLRVIVPHKGVSVNAQGSKRLRTEEYADTHKGVSVNAQGSKRERSPTNTETNSVKKTETSSDTNSVNNTDEEWITNYLKEKI
jgi:hypothetical protein